MAAGGGASRSRRAMLAKIHIAKNDLGLDDGAYRQMLGTVIRKGSCSDASERDLERVLEHLKTLGWRPRGRGGRPRAARQARKIRALWFALADAGVVRHRGEAALRAYVRRQTGIAAVEWLEPEDASRVIEALKLWCRRVGVEVD